VVPSRAGQTSAGSSGEEEHPDRARRDGVVLADVEQLPADPHLGGRILAEREVPPVHHETPGDRPRAGQRGRDGGIGPPTAAQQQAARGGSDGAADDGPAADDLAAQVRGPVFVLLDERAILAWFPR
jgi:hypothetical protein